MTIRGRIGEFFKKAAKYIKGVGKKVYAVGKNFVNTVYHDLKSVVGWAGKEVNKIIDTGAGFIKGKFY